MIAYELKIIASLDPGDAYKVLEPFSRAGWEVKAMNYYSLYVAPEFRNKMWVVLQRPLSNKRV